MLKYLRNIHPSIYLSNYIYLPIYLFISRVRDGIKLY